jgi:hypothetical protein
LGNLLILYSFYLALLILDMHWALYELKTFIHPAIQHHLLLFKSSAIALAPL